jgi:hypothetical protein
MSSTTRVVHRRFECVALLGRGASGREAKARGPYSMAGLSMVTRDASRLSWRRTDENAAWRRYGKLRPYDMVLADLCLPRLESSELALAIAG